MIPIIIPTTMTSTILDLVLHSSKIFLIHKNKNSKNMKKILKKRNKSMKRIYQMGRIILQSLSLLCLGVQVIRRKNKKLKGKFSFSFKMLILRQLRKMILKNGYKQWAHRNISQEFRNSASAKSLYKTQFSSRFSSQR